MMTTHTVAADDDAAAVLLAWKSPNCVRPRQCMGLAGGGVLTSSGCRKILGVRRERISVNTSVLLMMTREAVLSCYYYMLSSV
jgi:hypothetical protein